MIFGRSSSRERNGEVRGGGSEWRYSRGDELARDDDAADRDHRRPAESMACDARRHDTCREARVAATSAIIASDP